MNFIQRPHRIQKEPEAKALFEKFASVELEHERALQETYKRMKAKYIV